MLERLLILSAVLFCIGLYGALSRRHLIAVLISIEIMFNAVNVALVAVSRFTVPAAMRSANSASFSRDSGCELAISLKYVCRLTSSSVQLS